ncbi:MAG: methyl-accepting chemotaxis protein [Eubacteriales bacterium]
MRSIKIQTKILILSVVMLVIVGVVGISGITGTKTMYNNSREITEKVSPAVDLILNIDRDAQQAMVALRSELLPGNLQWKKLQNDDYLTNVQQTFERWDKYKAIGDILPEEKSFQSTFETKRKAWLESSDQIHKLALQNTMESSAKANNLLENDQKKFEEMRDQLDGLEGLYEKYSQSTVSSINGAYKNTTTMQTIFVVAGILLGIGLSIIIGQSITKPIKQVIKMLTDLAQGDGDLTKRLSIVSHDEIGKMSSLVNDFLEKLHIFVKSVTGSVVEVSSIANQLSVISSEAAKATQQVVTAIDEVARGNNEQNISVNQSVQTVNQVTKAIEQISLGAQEQNKNVLNATGVVENVNAKIDFMAKSIVQVKNAAQRNGEIAQEGGKAVEKTVVGMGRVKNAVFETANRIKELGEQSQQIGEIIQVIDDIAEQTNLLALNAAIEAARAAEHGKGFAVVADEVRKLAERAGKATKEIADLISNIQNGTNTAVESMQVGTREVEEGVSIAQAAGKSLQEIIEVVGQVSLKVGEITNALDEVLGGSQEVSRSISNLAAITEENTAATEEISASAEQVSMSMQNIAAITEESAAAVAEVSSSTEEVLASTEEVAMSAQNIAGLVQKLQALLAQFRI